MKCGLMPTRARGKLLSCQFWDQTVNADLKLRVKGVDGGKNETSTGLETSKLQYTDHSSRSEGGGVWPFPW